MSTMTRPRGLLLVVCLVAGPVGAAEPPDAPDTAERGEVAEPWERPAAPPCACDGGCGGLRPGRSQEGAFLGAWPARGIGLALGISTGLGLESRPEGASALRGWRNADAAVIGGALAVNLTTRFLDRKPVSLTGGRWSDCRGGTSSLGSVDGSARSALVGRSLKARATAARISDMTLVASMVSPFALALGTDESQRGRDALVVTETLAVSLLVNDAVKRIFDRPRPFAHFCEPQDSADLDEQDAHYSFYSGHASTSFAAAVAAGTISHYRGDRNERWIWATGLTLATTTGVLRIVADKHYLVDVMVGAAAGGAAGWLIPRLHRPAKGIPAHANESTSTGSLTALALPLTRGDRGRGVLRAGFGPGPFAELHWRW